MRARQILLVCAASFAGLAGCAHKQRVEAKPGVRRYEHCREVSINAKTGEMTFICPPQKESK